MALPVSGEIKFSNLQSTFGGTGAISLSSFYRNGAKTTKNNLNVPTANAISLSNFYNASKLFSTSVSGWASALSVNLRAQCISLGWNQDDPVELTVNTDIGSTISTTPGLLVSGAWPRSLTITVNTGAIIYGAGGNGGVGTGFAVGNEPGANGGTALKIDNTTTGSLYLRNSGTIAGGGGGGGGGDYSVFSGNANGGGGGGGGAGYYGGTGGLGGADVVFPASNGGNGGLVNGGAGGLANGVGTSAGGDGGSLGSAGAAGQNGNSEGSGGEPGGAAGKSVEGYNRITGFLAPWDPPGPLPGTLVGPTAST